MASKHKQEDPWAGFVDVLSNILMVVIFLVVILGISIFAISQQITKNAVEKAIEKERSETTKSNQTRLSEATQVSDKEASHSSSADKNETQGAAMETESANAANDSAGDRQVSHVTRVRQKDEIKGDTSLTVRSLRVNENEELEVASEEVKPSFDPIKVDESNMALKLSFSKGSFRIDEKTRERIKDYFVRSTELKQAQIEIRAFAQSTIGSVSEARRIAYYRAMQARTELLKNGYKSDDITIKVRESISPEEIDAVHLIRKS